MQVVRPGKTCDACSNYSSLVHVGPTTTYTFMEEWNEASLLQEFGQRQVSHECWTDASGSFGCGAVWGVEWLQVEWPTAYMVRDRALREESTPLFTSL